MYLLRPEEPREVELKDFTIMKPKNNKMHRLLRYYPRCEITYRAVPPPPPEEKVVTSPRGTTTTVISTTTHRHNGGFSNPSRNAEVFRLKRQLLGEYFASLDAGADPFGQYGVESVGRSGFSGLNTDVASARYVKAALTLQCIGQLTSKCRFTISAGGGARHCHRCARMSGASLCPSTSASLWGTKRPPR